MICLTNSHYEGKCCAICKYWYGEAVEHYNPKNGSMLYNGDVMDDCERHNRKTLARDCCESFVTEYVYSREFAPDYH